MATNSTWTIVFEDKMVIKNYAEGAVEGVGYVINDDSFWSQSKFSNIWAIQHGTSTTSDEVEYKDGSPNSAYDEAVLGPIQDFINKWDEAHLAKLQGDWDHATIVTYNEDGSVATTESVEDQTARMGPRPTSYSS
jgi:hypothetical protein|tara:strand:- start:971 stop:1375 length:405 start_codon:yes stop_codon:yes gene_type:complete